MTVYTYSEARQNLATLLDTAATEGEILIKRRDGSMFVVSPVTINKSPLDVEGVDVEITAEEIVNIVRDSRER